MASPARTLFCSRHRRVLDDVCRPSSCEQAVLAFYSQKVGQLRSRVLGRFENK